MIKEVYSGVWLLEKEERLRECKRDSSRVWEKAKYRSKKIGKVGYGRGKRF